MNSNLTTGNNRAPHEPAGKRVLIAMSGGVDSSVAAFLLRQSGYDCAGAMMKLFDGGGDGEASLSASNRCCTLADAEDARAVATRLGMPFYVFNFTQDFEERVMTPFAAAYQNGQTPNPCIDCNRYMKFEKFLRRAMETEHDYIATGHYACVKKNKNGRRLLMRGADSAKDQSYVLYAMTQEQLSRTLFPLGGMTKEEVRALAAEAGLANAKKRDSQDICFAPDGDYAGFITRYGESQKAAGHENAAASGEASPGDFIGPDGKILGRHRGIINYTIGQRKGLGISAPHPLYVCKLDAAANTVHLGPSERLFSRTLTAGDINLIPFDALPAPLRVTAKIRYSHTPQTATLRQTAPNQLHIEFDRPQRAITPGQAVVCYDGDTIIGGGTIE